MTKVSANDVRNDFAETLNRLDALAGDPRPPWVEALQGPSDLCRVRVGDYRIVYQLECGWTWSPKSWGVPAGPT